MTGTQSPLRTQRARLAIVLMIGVAALAACMAALLWWQAEPARATFPGQNGKITFEGGARLGSSSTGTDIFSVGLDGSGVSQLTETDGSHESNPSYSADGSKVVFDTDRDGNQEIYTMDADGGNETRLTIDSDFSFTFDGEPTFSPSGSEIVFARYNDKGLTGIDRDIDIYTMAASPSAAATRVVRVPGIDYQPSFKPDGSQILFTNSGNGSTIYVVDRDGSNLTPLAEGHNPVWSPDGDLIAYEYGGQVFMMNADGSNQQAVGNGGDPTFSPDCTRIAYANRTFVEDPSGEGGSPIYGIFTANLTGGDEQTVFTSSENLRHPDWQPLLGGTGGVDCPPLPPPPPTPQLSIEDASVTEGDSGTSEATFGVTLSDPGQDTVTVNYDTFDGTASQPDDYQQSGGTLTFGPSETTKTVTVPVNGDTAEEGDENFLAFLYDAQNADLADDIGLGTIVDDDVSTGNQVPVAADDIYNINEDNLLAPFPPGVLGNDTDADGDSLTAVLVSGPSHGELALNADGSFTYTSAANYNGSDSFTYKARDDGGAESDVAQVSITVTPVNDAPAISLPGPALAYTENDPPTVIDPLATVSDPDSPDFENGTLSIGWLLSQPGAGTADDRLEIRNQGTAAGEIGLNGSEVTYGGTTIGSFTEGSGTRTLSITFNANATPAAAQELVRNITYRNVSDAPLPGLRRVRFTLSDGDIGGTRIATKDLFIFPVNDAPVANGDSYKINEDTKLMVSAADGLFKNDTDADSANLTASLVDGPAHGDLALNADGSFSFTPAGDYNGSDSFTYKASDSTNDSNVATVNITVTPVNDAPAIALPGPVVLYTENDPPTVIDPLATVSDLDSPDFEGGRLSISYAFPGIRTVDDRLEIRNQGTAAGEIGLNGSEVTYGGTTIGTFEGGSGTRFSLVITFNANATPAAVQELARNITYRNVSDAPVVGPRLLRFTLFDGDGAASNPADKNVFVNPVNDAPVNAVSSDQSTNEDTALTFNSANNNLITISDVDAGTNAVQVRLETTNSKLTLSGTSGLTFASGDSGSVDSDMTFTGAVAAINSALNGLKFDPDANYNGAATLKITTDDQGNTGTGGALNDADTVNITVNAANDAPIATDDNGYETNEDTALVIDNANTLAANDSAGHENESDQNLSVTEVSAGADTHGTVSLTDGKITYTPDENYNGPASFDYKVCDEGTTNGQPDPKCDTGTVSLTVNAVNDPPVAVNDSATTNEDTPVAIDVKANDTDVDGDSLSVASSLSDPAHGTVELITSGTDAGKVRYTPDANYNKTVANPDTFTYKVNDETADSNAATVSVAVDPVNDAPTCNDVTLNTDEDTQGSTSPECSDVDGDTLTYAIDQQGQHGIASVVNGELKYDPELNFNGPDSFTYKANDGTDDSNVTTVRITVRSANDPPVISLPGPALAYTENDAPTVIDPLATVSDPDSPTSFASGRLSVSLELTGPADGVLDIRDQGTEAGQIGFNGSEVTYGGTTIGFREFGAGGPLPLAIRFNPNATPAAVQELVRNITYHNSSDTPPEEPRLVRFTLSDGRGGTGSATKTINVIAVNDAPVNANDSYSISEDTKLTVSATDGLLNNDTDVESNTLHVADAEPNEPGINPVSGPSNGTLTLNADGSFEYMPAANYNGSDSFDYRICDNGSSEPKCSVEPATVNISVNAVNDAPVISLPGPALDYTENDAPTVIDPLATVSDPDSPANFAGARLSVSLELAGPADGVLDIRDQGTEAGQIGFNGSEVTYGGTIIGFREPGTGGPLPLVIRFNPNATPTAVQELVRNITYHNGSDTPPEEPRLVRFTLSDGRGGTGSATKTINVIAVNDTPFASDDAAATDEDTATVIDVMANDNDVDNAMADLSVMSGSLSDPANGTVELNSEGKILYTPDADYNTAEAAADTFTYKVSDGADESNAATVSITVNPVNDAPVADIDRETTPEDTPVYIDVLANDNEGAANEGTQTLTVNRIVDAPANGTAQIITEDNPNKGTILYTPNANYNGPDTFTYEVCDDGDPIRCTTENATINVTVSAVNDAPTASGQSVTTDEDIAKSITLSASDSDGDAMSYEIVDAPTRGNLSGTGANLNYTPEADYNGPDSFTFKANDGDLDSNVATVDITVNAVNDTPVAVDDTATTPEDTAVEILASNLFQNDSTGPANESDQTLRISAVSGATNGQAEINGAGNVLFTPAPNFNGLASFNYTVCDDGIPEKCFEGTATVSVTVSAVNDAPVAEGQLITTDEDTPKNVTLGATDVENDNLTYEIVAAPEHGTLSGSGANRTYTPAANYNGPDSFTFKANDSNLDSNVATVSITVTAVNDPPVAQGDSYDTNQDTALNVAVPGVLANDNDPDGDSFTAELVSGPSHGQLTLNANGSFTYTPNANYNGPDSFTYRANDGKTAGNTATVSITVKPVVDTAAPTVVSVNPSDPQTPVSTTTNITVTFSEAMDESTLNDNTVKLIKPGKKPTSIPMTITTTTDGSGRTVLTLNPYGSTKQNLVGNTTYQLTIEGAGDGDTFAVKDLAGNELVGDAVSSFTTARR